MSMHFNLLIELDLVTDLPEEELCRVRRLMGVEPMRTADEDDYRWIEPVQLLDLGSTSASAQELPLPGGVTAQLSRRAVSTGAPHPEVRWSVAIRALLLDDAFYEDGWQIVDWLARRSATRGFIGQAREEFELSPSWIFVAADGFGYALVHGGLIPLSDDAPPPPADLAPSSRS